MPGMLDQRLGFLLREEARNLEDLTFQMTALLCCKLVRGILYVGRERPAGCRCWTRATFVLGVLQYGHCCKLARSFHFCMCICRYSPPQVVVSSTSVEGGRLDLRNVCTRCFLVHVPTHPSTWDVAGEAINCPAASRNEQMTTRSQMT